MTSVLRAVLTELADAPFAFELEEASAAAVTYSFEDGAGTLYACTFVRGGPGWFYSFDAERHGTGQPARVFATVLAVLVGFLGRFSPDAVWFEGSNDRLDRLYAASIPRLAKEVAGLGYSVERASDRTVGVPRWRVFRREALTELADAPFKHWLQKSEPERGDVQYEFSSDCGRSYRVYFEREVRETWDCSFALSSGDPSVRETLPARVFGTVVACLIAFLGDEGPERVRFTGASSALDGLYERAIPRIDRLCRQVGYFAQALGGAHFVVCRMTDEDRLDESAGAHGEGWWYRADAKRLVPIEEGALGPHGDHDGWIAIDSVASELGLDPARARLFRMATYGFSSADVPPGHEAEAREIREEDDWVDMTDGEMDWLFLELFGADPEEARQYPRSREFQKLVRVRRWPPAARWHGGYTMLFCSGSVGTSELLWARAVLDRLHDPSRDGPDPEVMLEGWRDGAFRSTYMKVMSARDSRGLREGLLAELADAPYEFERTRADLEMGSVRYKFFAGDPDDTTTPIFRVELEDNPHARGSWELSFTKATNKFKKVPAARVFSTVLACLFDHLRQCAPRAVVFMGGSLGLRDFYRDSIGRLDRMLRHLGYRARATGHDGDVFVVERLEPLSELGDGPYPFRKVLGRNNRVTYVFGLPGEPSPAAYEVALSRSIAPGSQDYVLGFELLSGEKQRGTGARVFATVVACFESFLEEYEPRLVSFGAASERLFSLYSAGIDRLRARVGAKGYDVKLEVGVFFVRRRPDA